MTAGKSSSLVPKLRFPGFRDAGDWYLKRLNEIARTTSDRVGAKKCVPMSVTTGVGLVTQEERFGRIIAGDSFKNYIRLQTNDFAYNKSSTKEFPQGYIARYIGTKDAAVPNSIFTCFRPHATSVVPEFLDHLFHGNHHGRWLQKFIKIGARVHGALNVSDDDLMSMLVPLPPGAASSDEQQKIADCLGSLDSLIAAESRKLEALWRYKQGLMQQLFPSIDESQPRARFPKYLGAGTWKQRRVSELIQKISIPFKVLPDKSYREIGVRSHGKGVFHKDPSPGSKIGGKRVFQVVENALVLNIVFAWERAVAVTSRNESGMIASHRFPMFVPRESRCDIRFIKYALLTQRGATLLGIASPGGAGRNRTLGQEAFAKLHVIVPDEEEQREIADMFEVLDSHIEAQTQRHLALLQHKQGLLQQLFPSMEGTR